MASLDSFQGVECYGLCKEYGTAGYHQVEIVRRDADGTLTRGMCKNVDGTVAEFNNDVGHNQPSVVVDGAGYIHVFTSMHVNLLRYFRSARLATCRKWWMRPWTFRMWTGSGRTRSPAEVQMVMYIV
ncbi:BNR repeat-containing protein [Klebsiella pneumoniae subsp. pneumoniae]|nr:BNR repeat-containing protein [Klebsiella pneumoniae subsp. pneumoniae]